MPLKWRLGALVGTQWVHTQRDIACWHCAQKLTQDAICQG